MVSTARVERPRVWLGIAYSARYIVYEHGIEGGRGTSSAWRIGSGLRVSTVGVVVALAASLLLMISTIRL